MNDLYEEKKEELDKRREEDPIFVVEKSAEILSKHVKKIVDDHAGELDDYIDTVNNILLKNEPTNAELNKIIMNIPVLVYYLSAKTESVSLRENVAKEVYKDVYHTTLLTSTGTDTVKKSKAEERSQKEKLTSIAYTNAYKTLNYKVDIALELLNSAKKVLSARLSEMAMERGDK